MTTIADRLKSALAMLSDAESKANRVPQLVKLLAVSKTKPVSDIVLAYEAGQRMFGENYVQEGVKKIQSLQELKDIEWHFIGPLQSNKTKLVAEHFDWVQSIDRLKIATRLNDQRNAFNKLKVCIQVNINQEENKAGVLPQDVDKLAEEISQLPQLQLRGLMAIPKGQQTVSEQNQTFAQMQKLFAQLQSKHANIDTLSMGMSQDMNAAIAGGATMVRIGTAIFGARSPKTSSER